MGKFLLWFILTGSSGQSGTSATERPAAHSICNTSFDFGGNLASTMTTYKLKTVRTRDLVAVRRQFLHGLIQKQILISRAAAMLSSFETNKQGAMTALRVFIHSGREVCVRSLRCRRGSCWSLSEAESCQSFAEQPTWQNTCLKLMPIDHHERGKIAGHAGVHPLWGKQTITVQQHKELSGWLTQTSVHSALWHLLLPVGLASHLKRRI